MAIKISLKELVSAGAHFGHQTRRWNPKMKKYLYGSKEGVHIFDLAITKEMLEEALKIINEASKNDKAILLVGTKKQAKEKVKEVAKQAGIFYVNERWLGGTLTNFNQIKASLRKLDELKKGLDSGDFKNRTKKERLLISREIDRLERFFGGLVGLEDIPDLLIIIDTRKEKTAAREARNVGVETVGVVDSNADPSAVDYPIPMNDDASRAVDYVLELFKGTIMEGKDTKKSKIKKEGPIRGQKSK